MRCRPFFRSLAATCALALLAACGAKTGLQTSGDAGTRPDAPVAEDSGFDTFPCRWTYSRSVELTRGALDTSFGTLRGAVAPVRNEALSLVAGLGGVTDLADPPSPLHEVSVAGREVGDVVGREGGWAEVTDDGGCAILWRDEAFERVGRHATTLPTPCFGDQTDAATVLVTAVGERRITVLPRELVPGSRATRFFEVDARASWARSVRLPEGGFLVAALADGEIDAYALRPGHEPLRATGLAEQPMPFVVAPDRLQGGMILLRLGPRGEWHLDRLALEGDAIELRPAADLSSLPAQPFTSLATNETEALFPLTNGALAFVPLNGSEPRVLDPVSETAITSMEVVLRPGQSTGGLVYTHAGPGEGGVLRFRPLVCNR